ncbi:hypothetical protein GCM10009665_70810 [Kitasatospora nipponensis]|uniref:Uncharacterized protein n=1 Tax=Kitasatospora nipponensis TaxID=258049 RepID=A0ABP4HPV8_9ACTN
MGQERPLKASLGPSLPGVVREDRRWCDSLPGARRSPVGGLVTARARTAPQGGGTRMPFRSRSGRTHKVRRIWVGKVTFARCELALATFRVRIVHPLIPHRFRRPTSPSPQSWQPSVIGIVSFRYGQGGPER